MWYVILIWFGLTKKDTPQEVWDCGSSVRFLDLNSNSIEGIPEAIGGLTSLQVRGSFISQLRKTPFGNFKFSKCVYLPETYLECKPYKGWISQLERTVIAEISLVSIFEPESVSISLEKMWCYCVLMVSAKLGAWCMQFDNFTLWFGCLNYPEGASYCTQQINMSSWWNRITSPSWGFRSQWQ